MKNKTFKIRPLSLALLLAGFGMVQASHAVDLMAVEGEWLPPGGTVGVDEITMWGFATGTVCPGAPVSWGIGPQLTDTDLDLADNLTINLLNCLSNDSVSIIIPGQPATFSPQTFTHTDTASRTSTRIKAFTHEATANGGTASYTWTGVKAGTYLYQSGSHPAKQVQMGLYGALTIGSYAGTSGDVTLLYSEIDPVLHSPPTAATPLGYHPRHFLVNGSESLSGIDAIDAGDTNQPTVLRMLNAGLDFHVPTLTGGYLTQVAEDGNAYPFAKQQYSVNLPAGKTIDALWQPASVGDHVIYDRRGPGMVASLTVGAGTDPVAVNDFYSTDEDKQLEVFLPGVLLNDIDTGGVNGLTATLVSSTSSGILSCTLDPLLELCADGSFTYTPDPDANGNDLFTYLANDTVADSNVASVTITVNPINDAPVAVDVAYDAEQGKTLSVATPGVLGNDTDLDGDTLTAVLASGPVGTLECPDPLGGPAVPGLCSDGSFDYTPTAVAPGTDSFTYFANDGTENSTVAATVNITIIAATNVAPVAVEDSATVTRNTELVFINLTDNDSDADGNLKDDFGNVTAAQIDITTGSTTTRGGTVVVLDNGVNYTPKKNFRGTDTFNYIVSDLDGAPSNEVTVRVNVVK